MDKSIQNNGSIGFLKHYMQMIDDINYKLPSYRGDTRERDKALLAFARSEPLLAGTLSTVVSRDKNRAWTLTGGARLVANYGRRLHELNDYEGWRTFISKLSTSFYSCNLGYAAEIGADETGVPQTMWTFDPTKVRLAERFNPDRHALYYYPNTGKVPLFREDYIHGNSLPSIEDELNNAGFCAVERSITVAKIMIGLFRHQLEKLGIAPPKGVLHAKGITFEEFDKAIEMANEGASNADYQFYKGILALFTSNTDSKLDLIGFSQLPENFELQDFIDIVMQSYALAFNYPVGQFWSIATGSFGRTGEMKVQESQSTAKGELEFAMSLQEQIQSWFLPSTLFFEFDVRNDSGKLIKTEMQGKEIDILLEMFHAGRGQAKGDDPLFEKEQILELMATKGYIPTEWTALVEDQTISDLKEIRERVRQNANIIRRAVRVPEEPILMYRYGEMDELQNTNFINLNAINSQTALKITEQQFPTHGTVTMLYESGEEMMKKKYY